MGSGGTMNKRQIPRGTYKAMLWDYDSLLTYSEDECCFSLSDREIQLMLGQLEYIGWKTRYLPTDTDIDQNELDRWRDNLARKLMSGCCPDEGKEYRYTEDGVLEVSTDGGVTWSPAPEDDIRLTAPRFPLLPGEDGNAKRCVAANNAVGQIKAHADQLGADAGAWGGLTLLLAAFLGILAFLSVFGTAGLLTPLVVGLMGTLLTAGRAAFIAAMTNEVYETLCCILYCAVDPDGTYTPSDIEEICLKIDDELDGLAAKYLKDTIRILGSVGLTNASSTMSSDFDFDCATCDCNDPCAVSEDRIVLGTLVSIDLALNEIVIDSVFDAGYGQQMVVYGPYDLSMCCTLKSYEVISGVTPGYAWLDCAGSPHFTTPVDEESSDIQFGCYATPTRLKLTFY